MGMVLVNTFINLHGRSQYIYGVGEATMREYITEI